MLHLDVLESRKRSNWFKYTLLYVEGHGLAKGAFGESKNRKRDFRYATYMTKIIEVEPSTLEEVLKNQEWKYSMNGEYQLIMKNRVLEVTSRHKDEWVANPKWLYNIRYAVDGITNKYKEIILVMGSSKRNTSIMKRNVHP